MNIGILYTGGTIGCVPDSTGSLNPLSYDEFKSAFTKYMTPVIQGQWGADTGVEVIGFKDAGGTVTSLDSTNLQPSDWCLMATQLLDIYNDYDGFIVLHGTDTMAWTASALSFLFTALDGNGYPTAVLDKAIIVTGAQLPLFNGSEDKATGLKYDTDAYQNVFGSVSSVFSGVVESCLFFNRNLFRGNRSIKSNASMFDAFSSPNYPSLGKTGINYEIDHDTILRLPPSSSVALSNPSGTPLAALTAQLSYISENINTDLIMPFPAFPAYYVSGGASYIADILTKIMEIPQLKGLILESYGEGNFPSGDPDDATKGAIYKALSDATAAGITIINCTQVLAGTVDANAYAAGAWMKDVGSVDSYDMIAVAALCKLIYLNTLKDYNNNNWSQTTLQTLMLTNIAGEIENINCLDAYDNSSLLTEESINSINGDYVFKNDYELGPILQDSTGATVWTMLTGGKTGPGRLIMQQDSNLVFYENTNAPSWASQTQQGSYTHLVLDNSGRLYLSNYNGTNQHDIYNPS